MSKLPSRPRNRRLKTDTGASDLLDYLQNYHRINLATACDRFLDVDDVSIGIWVKNGGPWRRDVVAERRLQSLKFNGKRSVCASIVTRLYALSPLEYRQIRMSFEEERWPSWSGIYEANTAEQDPEFVLVVELPVKASVDTVDTVTKVGAGAAVGLVAGLGGLALWNKRQGPKPDPAAENQRRIKVLQQEKSALIAALDKKNDDSRWFAHWRSTDFGTGFFNALSSIGGDWVDPFFYSSQEILGGKYERGPDKIPTSLENNYDVTPSYFAKLYKRGLRFSGTEEEQTKRWEKFFEAYITAVAMTKNKNSSMGDILQIKHQIKNAITNFHYIKNKEAMFKKIDEYSRDVWKPTLEK